MFPPDAERPTTICFGGLPDGVRLVLLGGKPGTGVRTVGRILRDLVENKGVAFEQNDDRTFHKFVPACEICYDNMRLQNDEPTTCAGCPSSLDVWSLYPAIYDAIANIVASQMYAENGNNGLIIVQGRRVISDTLLVRDANFWIWLDQDDLDICKIRYLSS